MARDLGTDIIAEVQKPAVEPVWFLDLEWPDGTTYAWTGIGPFTWGGHEYVGVGNFASVGTIPESSDGRANGITLGLSGIPSELIALVLGAGGKYQGRKARLYLGFLNSAGALVNDPPYLRFAGKMDVASIRRDGATADISLTIESRMIILQQSSGRRFTHEDQQIYHPGDLGLEYVAYINTDRKDNWGQPGSAILSRQNGASRQAF